MFIRKLLFLISLREYRLVENYIAHTVLAFSKNAS